MNKMNTKITSINTASPGIPNARVLIIYTGGTLGMVHDASGVLVPFDFSHILEHLPALRTLLLELTVISFESPIDSSNVEPAHWIEIANIIAGQYEKHDGFVILHGTDTMAYTASAMSFILKGIAKPVIFTGAQLPISEPRSDARENLITALEIAAAKENGKPVVPEVCVYFEYELLRGNRSKKVESLHFDAFRSDNYPPLAKAGVRIEYNQAAIRKNKNQTLELRSAFDTNVALLKLYPGISQAVIKQVLTTPSLRALVLETYGSGNAPMANWFISLLKEAIDNGLLIMNVSQCPGGMVMQGKYATSRKLEEIGVISGKDMTSEAAITKLIILLGNYTDAEVRNLLNEDLAGEFSLQVS
jgi:L-asparaginase